MEASTILNMVEDAFYNCFFIIDVIVSNDDSKIRAVLKHPSKCSWGQVLKSPKVKLRTEIPEPSFLADPSHRVKVVAKHIFSIVNESRNLRCGCTKVDALWLKSDWGYMIKNNRENLKSLVRQVRSLSNTCSTVMKIIVRSGASRQEHQKN